jgi:hypothetical protein
MMPTATIFDAIGAVIERAGDVTGVINAEMAMQKTRAFPTPKRIPRVSAHA